MKKLLKLNTYLKAAIASFTIVLLTTMFKLIFILLPIYSLAGETLSDDQAVKLAASQKLDDLVTLNEITTLLVYGGLLIGFITLSLGVYQITKHPNK